MQHIRATVRWPPYMHLQRADSQKKRREQETIVNAKSGSLLSNTGGRRYPSAFGRLISLILLFRFLPIWAWVSALRSLRSRVRTRRLLTTWKLLGEGVRIRGCSSEGCVPWRQTRAHPKALLPRPLPQWEEDVQDFPPSVLVFEGPVKHHKRRLVRVLLNLHRLPRRR